jgi:hypothetical protein
LDRSESDVPEGREAVGRLRVNSESDVPAGREAVGRLRVNSVEKGKWERRTLEGRRERPTSNVQLRTKNFQLSKKNQERRTSDFYGVALSGPDDESAK